MRAGFTTADPTSGEVQIDPQWGPASEGRCH